MQQNYGTKMTCHSESERSAMFDLQTIAESPGRFFFPLSTKWDIERGSAPPAVQIDSGFNISPSRCLLGGVALFGSNKDELRKKPNISTSADDSQGIEISKEKLLIGCNLETADKGVTLVWRDLTVTIGDRTRKAIQSLTGYARPGTMLGILGPPAAGKSVMLQALAGKLPRNAKTYGEILVNGRSQQLQYGIFAFVRSEGELIETLTIRETLYYAALLQLPDGLSCSDKIGHVDALILEMNLQDVAETRIGKKRGKGLSAGQRRRVSIAMQLLTKPWLVFVDDPVHCLDSYSSFLIMEMLKRLTAKGCTVITSHQQLSSELFSVFDKVCLLSSGRTVFFGRSLAALEQYETAGIPCPRMYNPADHLLRAINSDYDRINAPFKCDQESQHGDEAFPLDSNVTIRTLQNLYQASGDVALVQSMVAYLYDKGVSPMDTTGHASPMMTLGILTWRSILNMWRDFRYFWLRLILCSVLSVSIGTVFCHTGHSYSSITARATSIYIFISNVCLMSITGFSAISKDIKVNAHERDVGYSGILSFMVANFVSSTLFLFLLSSICTVGAYFLLGLQSQFGHFFYFVVNLFLCLTIMESLMTFVASIVPGILEGIITLLIIQVFMTVIAGYYLVENAMPKPVWKYPLSYISFQTFSIEGLLKNEYENVNFPRLSQHLPTVTGLDAISKTYHAPAPVMMLGKWRILLVLGGMAATYRSLSCTALFLSQYLRNKWNTHLPVKQ